ncbi:MAG: RlmE family RNA methyltransferase [Betaproteobacteria bacterium]|jgi:23S rRNA (uridine2552-2'-O)-methyltransferase|nr:RlmE family RNA methyltransferase [Betaproteobacteria bacterium]NCX67854.1 RlmE family RNA methyltransferase [Betaproteobacteria bacterium]
MKKTRTKKNWIKEHLSDEFVKRAQKDGFRSRAAYKFIEMNDKYHLIRSNDRIVDLGSAPGSWSQAASSLITDRGKIFAIDLLPMDDVKNTTFIQGDFRELSILQKLEELLENTAIDLVISDMAPNISGIKSRDQAMINDLNDLSLEFALDWLKPKGHFMVKTFMGSGFEDYVKRLRSFFNTVKIEKPDSSRDRSAEFFLIGLEKR